MSGLRLILLVGSPAYVHQIIQSSGVRVIVHNKTLKPSNEKGVDVSIGEEASIIVNRVFDSQLEYPYNDCKSNLANLDDFDSEFYKEIIKSNTTYTQLSCFQACIQSKMISNCKCYSPYFLKLNGTKSCATINDSLCGMKTIKDMTYDVIPKCSPLCPLQCDSIKYSLSKSNSFFPNPKYAFEIQNYFNQNSKYFKERASKPLDSIKLSYQELNNSIVAVNVYYDELTYTRVSQSPKMSFEDLLSNVGGTLGLFIGISFLSFAEIFEILFQVIFILFEKNEKSSSIAPLQK